MRNLSIVSELCSVYGVSMIDLFSGFVVRGRPDDDIGYLSA